MKELFTAMPGEQTSLVLRRHWIVFSRHVVIALLLLVAPVVAWVIVRALFPDVAFDPTGPWYAGVVLTVSALLLLTLASFFTAWVDYALDIWIVTDRRLLNVMQHGLFNRTVSEVSLDRIQDVTSDVRGVLKTVLKVGTVTVQSAGEQGHFNLESIANPDDVARLILELARAHPRQGSDGVVPPPSPQSPTTPSA